MKTLLSLQGRHWITQVTVTVGALACAGLTLFVPEVVYAKEAAAFLTTMVWVWGP